MIDEAPALGAKDAPVVLIEFTDFSTHGRSEAYQVVERPHRLSSRFVSMVQRVGLCVACGLVVGIAPPPLQADQATGAGEPPFRGLQQTAADTLTFEVASIRPSGRGSTALLADAPNRFSRSQVTVRHLIQTAYRGSGLFLPLFRIDGGPAWIRDERFDVHATTSTPATDAQKDLMLQNLLVERFGLSIHWEQRTVRGYALAFSREDRRLGPNLRPSAFDCGAFLASGKTLADAPKAADGLPICIPRVREDGEGKMRWEEGGTTMLEFADSLSNAMGAPVIDRTEAPGTFDVDVTYIDGELRRRNTLPPVDAVSFFTALQEQLGLKLEAIQDVPLRVLVIDSVHRPTEN